MTVPRCLALALALVFARQLVAEEPPPASPVPLARSAGKMTVPDGFHVTLFAGEPDVRNPIAITLDHRGRLWVAENFSYPGWLQKATEKDRIVVFEDSDGDGKFDRRTVFWDQGQTVSGLAVGFGGVFVCATPNLLFIPDKNGDDVPDGPPVVVLDGWDVKAQHNLFNALTWGPDGWLYGCNGIMSNSMVGTPGTPAGRRVAINTGVWRYHPTKANFEAFAHGTTNPWGLDFDDHGEAFITNCVIPHLFHVVPGAHFQRMYGQDMEPRSYDLLASCADHIHWAGGAWQDSRSGTKHGEAGGGHAHVGAMIYLGDNWPDEYRDSAFMCNIHGRRVNNDKLSSNGSSYVARHGKDFLFGNDPWFRGMELRYGPDGGVFLSDWSDVGECHENDSDGSHRENGRIYKVTYGKAKPVWVDLARLDDLALVGLQLHRNDWYVRNARRLLQERAASGKDMSGAHEALRDVLRTNRDETRLLRALWALHVTGGLDEPALVKHLDHENEYVRRWAVRLLGDAKPGAPALKKFESLARDDTSPKVRLALASVLQRLPLDDRWGIAANLSAHAEDVNDPYLPLMNWYGVAPLVPADTSRAMTLLSSSRIPLVRRFLTRRATEMDAGPKALVELLGRENDAAILRDVLTGMLSALKGRKSAAEPEGWSSASARLAKSPDKDVRKQATLLALVYGDPRALRTLRQTLSDATMLPVERREALQALVDKRAADLAPTLQGLLADKDVRGAAIRALAAYDDPATPKQILERYSTFNAAERADAVNALAARPAFARALLDAIGKGIVPARDLSVTTARQLLALHDQGVADQLEKVWGSVRPTSSAKSALMAQYKALLTPDRMKAADLSNGRAVYGRTCAQCHKLFDAGGDVGPDVTGSNRSNLDYLLENILDPSASVGREYKLVNVATRDGRVLSGIVREESPKTLVLQTVNERLSLDREEIEELKASPSSMMPEGALEKLSADEVRDLFGYLAAPKQVPLPSGSK